MKIAAFLNKVKKFKLTFFFQIYKFLSIFGHSNWLVLLVVITIINTADQKKILCKYLLNYRLALRKS